MGEGSNDPGDREETRRATALTGEDGPPTTRGGPSPRRRGDKDGEGQP